VNDHVAVVEQHPPGIGRSFLMEELDPRFIGSFPDSGAQRAHLSFAGGAANDEVIGQIGGLTNVEQNDVFRSSLSSPVSDLPGKG